MAMYDRAAKRGDPYEERVKLASKPFLYGLSFLFRIEQKHSNPGVYPLNQYELADAAPYFLWSTIPDDSLVRAAEQGAIARPQRFSQTG